MLLYLYPLLATLRPNARQASQQVAQAHTVEIVEDIGATLHIEPNDTPRAGEDTLAWFALTRKGGQTIPLSACNCELTVSAATTSAVLTPPLSAIDAEGYEDIPGAQFTFPSVGQYTLSLTGSPKLPDDFSPFTLAFDVTVAAGQAVPPASESTSATSPDIQPDAQSSEVSADAGSTNAIASNFATDQPSTMDPLKTALFGIGGVLLLSGVIWLLRTKQKP